MAGLRVAVVGATGIVGREFLRVLEQRRFPIASLRLLASDRSHSRRLRFSETEIEVEETSSSSFDHIELALFSAGTDVSLSFCPIATKKGAVVVDNSAAFRMEPDVPLVVPEVNIEDARNHKGIIANPNCSTIQMVVALYPLHRVNPIKRIVVATYQAVSGTGLAAMEELTQQVKALQDGGKAVSQVYPYQIAFNLFPHIDTFLENGYTKEEWKMVQETRKIMHAPDIQVSATCARVPVYRGHSEAVNVEFSRPFSPEEVRRILASAPGVKVVDDVEKNLYPYPLMADGSDDVYVGRIRKDASHPNGIDMWVVADNVRKGAALNAIQIAEEMLRRGWL